jgi:hypothetical protein
MMLGLAADASTWSVVSLGAEPETMTFATSVTALRRRRAPSVDWIETPPVRAGQRSAAGGGGRADLAVERAGRPAAARAPTTRTGRAARARPPATRAARARSSRARAAATRPSTAARRAHPTAGPTNPVCTALGDGAGSPGAAVCAGRARSAARHARGSGADVGRSPAGVRYARVAVAAVCARGARSSR